MRRSLVIVLAALVAHATLGGFAVADTLSDLRWQNRIVILFGADEDRLEQQARELRRDEAGLLDRDLLVLMVTGDEVRAVHGVVPAGETAETLRERFAIGEAEPYTAILVGKDGGEKWRGRAPVPAAEIDEIIDAMPMRRAGD